MLDRLFKPIKKLGETISKPFKKKKEPEPEEVEIEEEPETTEE